MVFLIFFISRLFLFFGAFIAQKTVPYLGFFPYKELLVEYHLPSWISALANFDGIHYLLIAKQNYSQWEQAFFPLYPLLIHVVSYIVPNFLVAALLVSNTSLLVGLLFFKKLLKEWGIKTMEPLFFLLAFPTAFFFGIVYTEGLFFMLFVLSLYFLQKKQYRLAGIFAALSSATRLIGIFLVIPFFFHFLAENKLSLKRFALHIIRYTFFLLPPLLGLSSYMSYLWVTTGDPLFFFNSQPIFGANRSTHLIFLPQVYFRYIKILLTAAHDFRWYMSLFEMDIFSLVFVVLIADFIMLIKPLLRSHSNLRPCLPAGRGWIRPTAKTYTLLGINIFSLFNLILPTLTGTFSSIPRYALFSLSFFLFISQIQSRGIKIGIVAVSITLQIILLSLFIQGYFVG